MIWIILVYVFSVIMFLNIMIAEIKELGLEITYENLFDYYEFNILWAFCPIVNTFIVLLWYIIKCRY